MISLGIDTGGTFTDAAILDAAGALRASAKAPTTRHDLAAGIGEAVGAVLAASGCAPGEIGLVGLSTTLATNAIVEGQGGRAGLVLIGFAPAQLARAGLDRALGSDPVGFVGGGHDAHGDAAAPLDVAALAAFLDATAARVDAYAIAAMFSVRNPAHEIQALELVAARTGLPATASHHLASSLDGPRRALTALLNARLVPIVGELIARCAHGLAAAGIRAPLMVVRGNGALMAAGEARRRPVETVLSGPAASAVGGTYLTGLADAVVADIGGTTTDIAVVSGGLPAIDPRGAAVGGYRTMVEAIEMATIGLGGDSELRVDDAAAEGDGLILGPRRLVPLAALAARHPDLVHDALDRRLSEPVPGAWDGRFAILHRKPASGLDGAAQARLVAALEAGPVPLDRLLTGRADHAALMRLVGRGLAGLSGFTPTDAAHVLGRHAAWDAAASRKGALLFLRRRDRRGMPRAGSAEELAARVLDLLVARSVDFALETCAARDGLDAAGLAAHPLARRALARSDGLLEARLRLTTPIVGLGASAHLHYPAVAAALGTRAEIPDAAGVANAIGAVVGVARRQAIARITCPDGGRFRVHAADGARDHATYDAARADAEATARRLALAALAADGVAAGEVRVAAEERFVEAGGESLLIESEFRAEATGRPSYGHPKPDPENHSAAIRPASAGS
ncbi:MAG: hydantoinase/oxoprolinase N-terminal domain-containing protein [Rhodospirillales bacterium]